MKRIWWLASYPKSGNTWVRAFLTSLVSGAPVDINDMTVLGGGIASARALVDDALGIECAELAESQQEGLRPRAYEVMAAEANGPIYLKAHDAYGLTAQGEPLFPETATAGAVYIARNPLDVAVSLAHYRGVSIAKAADSLLKPDACLGRREACPCEQFPQRTGDWASHVESWERAPFPVHIVRYEDLLADAANTFGEIARFLDRSEPAEQICRAIDDCAFDKLSGQENKVGFRSNSGSGNKFFRRGIAGAWRDELPPEQAARLRESFAPVMQRLGYS